VIGIKLQAQLGNQLSQYAFIYAAAKKLGCGFYLDREQNPFYPDKYFDLPQGSLRWLEKMAFAPVSISSGWTLRLRKRFYPALRKALGLRVFDATAEGCTADSMERWLEDRLLYVGWFQSEKYFANAADAIRALYVPRPQYVRQFQDIRSRYRRSGKKVVAVHVRGGDYADWTVPGVSHTDMRLPKSYFDRALGQFAPNEWQVIVATNDLGYAWQVVDPRFGAIYLGGNEIDDLQALVDADAVVMSNSSFSWWGAWLGERESRVVVCPKFYHGFREGKWVGREAIPDRWKLSSAHA